MKKSKPLVTSPTCMDAMGMRGPPCTEAVKTALAPGCTIGARSAPSTTIVHCALPGEGCVSGSSLPRTTVQVARVWQDQSTPSISSL
jgi:hypothetical protein